MSSGDVRWLRSRRVPALLGVALVMSLALAVVYLATDRPHEPDVSGGAGALSNEQARDQVVGSARQIVGAAGLRDVTGGYAFLSCVNEDDPPYQAVIYLNFIMPEANSVKSIDEIAAAMAAGGWREASPADGFGGKLTRNGVTAVVNRNVDVAGFGTLRIYGECRNRADHRRDDPAWTDIAGPLG